MKANGMELIRRDVMKSAGAAAIGLWAGAVVGVRSAAAAEESSRATRKFPAGLYWGTAITVMLEGTYKLSAAWFHEAAKRNRLA